MYTVIVQIQAWNCLGWKSSFWLLSHLLTRYKCKICIQLTWLKSSIHPVFTLCFEMAGYIVLCLNAGTTPRNCTTVSHLEFGTKKLPAATCLHGCKVANCVCVNICRITFTLYACMEFCETWSTFTVYCSVNMFGLSGADRVWWAQRKPRVLGEGVNNSCGYLSQARWWNNPFESDLLFKDVEYYHPKSPKNHCLVWRGFDGFRI